MESVFGIGTISCLSLAGWPGPAHSVAICEGLEDWTATDLSNLSDSEEDEQPAPLVRLTAGRAPIKTILNREYTGSVTLSQGPGS